jgi:hypothetical protein
LTQSRLGGTEPFNGFISLLETTRRLASAPFAFCAGLFIIKESKESFFKQFRLNPI